jgi:GNAT-family acetyltransferase (TIGR03103 family)
MERQEKAFKELLSPSLKHWESPDQEAHGSGPADVVIGMGWGRLIFAHTFSDPATLADLIAAECDGKRDVGFYIRDPHVILSMRPHQLFLDPSHTYRKWLAGELPGPDPRGYEIRDVRTGADVAGMNRIFSARQMMPVDPGHVLDVKQHPGVFYRVAVDLRTGEVLGTATGVDHVAVFEDDEQGSSFWCLAVSPQAAYPGVGRALVLDIAGTLRARGRRFMDLSVMHDNEEAIALYDRLGFVRVPVFCIKRKNPFNEPLFMVPEPKEDLNPYSAIIVHEARRRGIGVEVLDAEHGYFTLAFGGRSVVCRESLTELTSAIAMSRCDDKRVTSRLLAASGLNVPEQMEARREEEAYAFLARHGRVVVKPAQGEQGAGISVDVRTAGDLKEAILAARKICATVLVEQLVAGEDLRVVVIDYQVVAAAIRRPASVVGTGRHSIRQLIEKQSRRRAAATGGESRIPLDAETQRCVEMAGYSMEDTLPENETLLVRKTANLHTGGTIHDVTSQISAAIGKASVLAARALDIPVVGLDFITPDVRGESFVIIEANERPGLANHEPQPTAERFVDMLFPNTAVKPERRHAWRSAE